MNTDVEQIKERLSIVDVISGYIKVEKAGINYKAKCPFHNEKTASFFISPSRQSFYCFGCGEKGDIFSFVQKFEGLDFRGALEVLADKAGVELKNFKKAEAGEATERERLLNIMEEAAGFYEELLARDKEILGYLKKRGLEPSTVSKWRLGFARDEWRGLADYLQQRGFSKEEMLKAGLLKKVPGEEKYYDTFRNRVMFPISDSAGKVIAFSGRAMKENEKTPKYLNSPETKLFYKSETLYGFHLAKNHIRKQDYAVLVEGQIDLVMSHQAGVLNTVASSGTALTELHLQKIKKLTNKVLLAYDSDEAGEKAAKRAGELALSLGMEAKIATLEGGEDPASTIKENPEKWKSALRQSEHLIDFALNQALKKEPSGRGLAKEIEKGVLPLLPLLGSEMEKAQYVKKIALKTKMREESVWEDLKKIEKSKERNRPDYRAGIEKLEEEAGQEERDKKEELMYEAEKFGLKIDIEKVNEETSRRKELEELKQKLQEAALTLDDPDISPPQEKKAKAEIEKIQKKIRELTEKIISLS